MFFPTVFFRRWPQRLAGWLLLVFSLVVYPDSSVMAISKLRCIGAGAAELFVPGLGYAITGQWDKTFVLGGSRWITGLKAAHAMDSEFYQEDPDDIYKTVDAKDSASGKEETSVYLNRETWEGRYYGSLYSNLLLTTWADLYMNQCEENSSTYSYMLAPLQFDQFYKKWHFWVLPLLAASYGSTLSDEQKIDYFLGRGLTESQLRRESFPQHYMVGVGEEMFFRGALQSYFFETWKETVTPSTARHLAVFSGAAVFGLAHDGNGFSANPFGAFLFGVYQGYTYHPALDEFDLTTAIAIHSWYNIILTYAILNSADFHETEEAVQVPVMRLAFSF